MYPNFTYTKEEIIRYLIQARKQEKGIKDLPEKPTNWISGIIKKMYGKR